MREAVERDGRYWDEVQMGVLREEWLARARTATELPTRLAPVESTG